LREAVVLVARDRTTTAELLSYLAEIDDRRIFVPAGYSSMFAYCLHELHMSEDITCKRLCAARASRKFPVILDAVAEGRLQLSTVVLLAPHLTAENVTELVAEATHKTNAETERLLAHRFPKPDVPTVIQPIATRPKLGADLSAVRRMESPADLLVPAPAEVHADSSAARRIETPAVQLGPEPVQKRARVAPLAPQRFAVHMTIDQETHDLLQYAQQLLSHQIAAGDVPAVFARALKALIVQLEKQKYAATEKPRAAKPRPSTNTRHVPAAAKRAVRKRDGGRCTFVSDTGHRCEARSRLEFDHIEPVARGGQATVGNLRLRCRAHNQYAAECAFGAEFMSQKRHEARCVAAARRESVESTTLPRGVRHSSLEHARLRLDQSELAAAERARS
jgi:hypothetical protein